ncbi:hypothetical protein GM415_01195 [Pseudodesulfovibrio cashew]|uniref:Uncharacterized protein n=1 Tax=Pseudodesulfovibrio cashew TaxID=2678688 RepID=A0A6I6JCJ2_9BACT|nr:hypothetical protein [Pseudodesulfovibrio cashew]QGY38808.1 hypothetical protein GM415_01195 [Pseudodesulfovibrio cashew]
MQRFIWIIGLAGLVGYAMAAAALLFAGSGWCGLLGTAMVAFAVGFAVFLARLVIEGRPSGTGRGWRSLLAPWLFRPRRRDCLGRPRN